MESDDSLQFAQRWPPRSYDISEYTPSRSSQSFSFSGDITHEPSQPDPVLCDIVETLVINQEINNLSKREDEESQTVSIFEI